MRETRRAGGAYRLAANGNRFISAALAGARAGAFLAGLDVSPYVPFSTRSEPGAEFRIIRRTGRTGVPDPVRAGEPGPCAGIDPVPAGPIPSGNQSGGLVITRGTRGLRRVSAGRHGGCGGAVHTQ